MQMGKSAAVAQLVEQRIRNAWVGGSSPLSGTIYQLFYPLNYGALMQPKLFYVHIIVQFSQLDC